MSKTKFEDFLNQYGILTYRNTGISMLPMLKQGRDSFTVTKKTERRCQQYDVVLYRRPPDDYVLHRIIQVRKDDYVLLGITASTRNTASKTVTLSEFLPRLRTTELNMM